MDFLQNFLREILWIKCPCATVARYPGDDSCTKFFEDLITIHDLPQIFYKRDAGFSGSLADRLRSPHAEDLWPTASLLRVGAAVNTPGRGKATISCRSWCFKAPCLAARGKTQAALRADLSASSALQNPRNTVPRHPGYATTGQGGLGVDRGSNVGKDRRQLHGSAPKSLSYLGTASLSPAPTKP